MYRAPHAAGVAGLLRGRCALRAAVAGTFALHIPGACGSLCCPVVLSLKILSFRTKCTLRAHAMSDQISARRDESTVFIHFFLLAQKETNQRKRAFVHPKGSPD